MTGWPMLDLAWVTPVTQLLKKSGTSHTKTIKNCIDMESSIIHWPFNEKKNCQKSLRTIFKITSKLITRPVLPHISV